VVQDVVVVASGILKGIGKDGHYVKGTIFVDVASKSKDCGGEPGGVKGNGSERVAENLSD
jgi:hypothetical protein